MRRRLASACIVLAAISALAGCGQKGNLFLPGVKPATTPPATAAASAASTQAPPAGAAPAPASSTR